jgi:predicted Zn-dependent protease with MMP-like domain
MSCKKAGCGRVKNLSTEAFSDIVEQAVSRIPAEIRRKLDNIVISVQPYPSEEILEELGLPPGEGLFGFYSGVPLIDRSATDPPLYPDTIFIFQQPLEAYCRSREELLEEIEITVVHEIAHFFGFDDEQLNALGYS